MLTLLIMLGLALVAFSLVRPAHSSGVRQALYEHLCVMARCHLAFGPGLRALADERLLSSPRSRRARRAADAIRGVASRLEATGSLATALEGSAGRLVSPGQIDLLRTAEANGALPDALELLCEEQISRTDASWRLLEWLAYPLALSAVLLPMALFHGSVILPKFEAIASATHVPGPDTWLHSLSKLLILALLFGGLALLALAGRDLSPRLTRALTWPVDRLVPGAPFRRLRHGRWLRHAAALLSSGATLPEALDGAARQRTVDGRPLEAAARRARAGDPLEVVLSEALGPDAPRLLAPTLMAAKRCGSLGAGFEASGRRAHERASRQLAAVAEALRPVPIAALGLLAGTQIYGVFSMISSMQSMAVHP